MAHCWCAGPCLCRRAEDAATYGRPWADGDDGVPEYVPDAEREAS